MSVILSLHLLVGLASISTLWLRAALAFENKWELANHKALLLASTATTLLLLISAFILMFWHDQFVFSQGWVTEKLLWLVLYVIFGVAALLPRLPTSVRAIGFALATSFFALAFVVAKFKIPLLLAS